MASKIRKICVALIPLMGFFIGDCMVQGAHSHTSQLLSKMASLNKFAQYNSHISRMRRSTQSASGLETQGTNFRVGACSLEDFLGRAKNCSHEFYRSVRRKDATRSKCGEAYTTLHSCMISTLRNCIDGSLVGGYLTEADKEEIQNNFLVFLGKENFWCDKGGIGLASDFLPVGAICDPVFHQVSEGCTATYSRIFNTSASDGRLCAEYHKAKTCFLKTIFQHCSFSRTLFQMLEIMVEMTADFQPFCHESAKQELLRFEDLLAKRTCPPYSLADVAILFDVTNGTTRQQFLSMKRIVQELTRRVNYGWNGIHIAVYQFDSQLRNLIRFGKATTKTAIQRQVRKMRRTTTMAKNKQRRMIGRSLSALARGTFSPNKGGPVLQKEPKSSGQRPHNTAVTFVFTTGPSSDSMVTALETLKDRNVHVVFTGPRPLNIPAPSNKLLRGQSYPIIDAKFKFEEVKEVAEKVVHEICDAERQNDWGDGWFPEREEPKSKWSFLQSLLSRMGIYDLSLLFELRPIVPTKQSSPPPPTNIFVEGTSTLVEAEEFSMDGDILPSLPIENKPMPPLDYMGRPIFFVEHEYIQEYYTE